MMFLSLCIQKYYSEKNKPEKVGLSTFSPFCEANKVSSVDTSQAETLLKNAIQTEDWLAIFRSKTLILMDPKEWAVVTKQAA